MDGKGGGGDKAGGGEGEGRIYHTTNQATSDGGEGGKGCFFTSESHGSAAVDGWNEGERYPGALVGRFARWRFHVFLSVSCLLLLVGYKAGEEGLFLFLFLFLFPSSPRKEVLPSPCRAEYIIMLCAVKCSIPSGCPWR